MEKPPSRMRVALRSRVGKLAFTDKLVGDNVLVDALYRKTVGAGLKPFWGITRSDPSALPPASAWKRKSFIVNVRSATEYLNVWVKPLPNIPVVTMALPSLATASLSRNGDRTGGRATLVDAPAASVAMSNSLMASPDVTSNLLPSRVAAIPPKRAATGTTVGVVDHADPSKA